MTHMPEQTDPLRTMDPMNAEWVTFLLLAVFAALAWTNMSSPRKWRLLAQAMFRMRLGRQTLREEIDLQDRTFIGLLSVAVVVLALFLWQAMVLTMPLGRPSYAWLGSALLLLLMSQGVVLRGLEVLIGVDRGITEYLSTGLLLFILSGVVLLPVVTLMAYRSAWRPGLLAAGMVLLTMLLLYRWVRGAWVGMGEGVPVRYIILYLCAAEVAPVLLMVHAWIPHTSLNDAP